MSKFDNRKDLAAKVEWEGGIESAIDYGIKADDMPDEELRALWLDAERAYKEFEPLRAKIEDILDGEVQ